MSFKSRQSPLLTTKPGRGASISPAAASVLIVDDSETMRSILRVMLARLGFNQVDEAANGKDALAMVRARSYTLIISDWHMEPMNGIELLDEVRRVRKPGSNRFIFSTSESSWGSRTTAKDGGAEAFLVKPFTVEALKSKIDAMLQSETGAARR